MLKGNNTLETGNSFSYFWADFSVYLHVKEIYCLLKYSTNSWVNLTDLFPHMYVFADKHLLIHFSNP